jgi:hypothetical protein
MPALLSLLQAAVVGAVSDFKEVFANNYCASKVDPCCLGPHLLGDLWIIRRHKVGKHEGLDARGLRDAARVLC